MNYRLKTLLLFAAALAALLPSTLLAASASEGVEWAKSQANRPTPYQCSAFVQLYTEEFFGWGWSGNAIGLSAIRMPAGWERERGASAADVQAGDILVFRGSGYSAEYGHTGIAIGKGQMVDANGGHGSNLGAGTKPGIHEFSSAGLVAVLHPPYGEGESAAKESGEEEGQPSSEGLKAGKSLYAGQGIPIQAAQNRPRALAQKADGRFSRRLSPVCLLGK
jgi:hypothetical protein